MPDLATPSRTDLFDLGHRAALRVWADDPDAALAEDPRHPDFAEGVLSGLTQSLKAAPGAMKRVVRHAGAAAEDLNVDAFQGLVEVLQNADDLGARHVRFALSGGEDASRLMIAHDGAPVSYQHVLAMMLPYLTTKSGDAEQKGRFGIGLKTLKRISTGIGIHSAPYHFTADGLDLHTIVAAPAIEEFYRPGVDTLFVLDLVAGFSSTDLQDWFNAWSEDELIFLRSVRSFAWFDLDTGESQIRKVEPGPWTTVSDTTGELPALTTRRVHGSEGSWTLFRAEMPTPDHLNRSHKATGAATVVQIALPDHDHPAGLFIGFRTRIPVSLPFSIDAQFDPTTAREGLISNAWNRWLISRCGDVVAAVGFAELRRNPANAWAIIPLPDETVGVATDGWPRPQFDAALSQARDRIGQSAELDLGKGQAPLTALAYESTALATVLSEDDLALLAPDKTPLPEFPRDHSGRWRLVLDALATSREVTPTDLANGFSDGRFGHKPTTWWVEAAVALTECLDDSLYGIPCFLTDQGKPQAAVKRGETARRLLIGEPLSAFAARWNLFERLNDVYATTEPGDRVITWLLQNAAVASSVDAADELAAFAETFVDKPVEIAPVDLIGLRERFDLLTDVRAGSLGLDVGRAILLDGFVYRGAKRTEVKIRPVEAYLSRTLDSDHPYWPEAAGSLPMIPWLSASYDVTLKTGATRAARKRADGTISRGPRKFLMLLGAACAPRVGQVGRRDWGRPGRVAQLRALGAEFTPYDYVSPDLDRVLSAMERLPKKERKQRSAALLKCLSRYWPSYAGTLKVPAHHMAIKYAYVQGEVPSEWLGRLLETAWVAVGTGLLRVPSEAVVRTPQTQTLYGAEDFIFGVTADDLRSGLTAELKIITDVRASDLVGLLEQLRDSTGEADPSRVLGAYRSLAKLCPTPVGWNSRIGDLPVQELRRKFSEGEGLILVPGPEGSPSRWRRPDELFMGKDIFLDPSRFVPGGPSLSDLWHALQVRRPTLDDCISALRDLAARPYGTSAEAELIEIYRYIEPMIAKSERRHRERLRTLPVGAVNVGWARDRPIYHVEDRELRGQLAQARPDLRFWAPPCDVHALPNISAALGLTRCHPTIDITPAAAPLDLGAVSTPHFQHCVDHLSNELTRNDPVTRGRLGVTWPELRETQLFVYEEPFPVSVRVPEIAGDSIQIAMRAVLRTGPLRLHIDERAIANRENGGRAIASLFPSEVQRRIEAEWVASWHASSGEAVERIATASDEEHARAMAERAAASTTAIGTKIKVSTKASRGSPSLPPRRLKETYGEVSTVTVLKGRPPKPASPSRGSSLSTTEPPASPPPSPSSVAPRDYSNLDLEQQGWEILSAFLNASEEVELVDFRKRHRVGADGVINWRTFVELKATGGGPQTSVEMSATEFDRARERGLDFIIALVSGMEEGEQTEIRLILDPTNRADVRPVGAVRLAGLTQCASIAVRIGDATE